jgi:hypothetical protein
VNGDGYSDIIVGAPCFDGVAIDQGGIFVYHGSSTGLPTAPNWTKSTSQDSAHFGQSVSTVGDVNGDGYSDVIIGAPLYDLTQHNSGTAFLFYGGAMGLTEINYWNPGWTPQAGANLGFSVATAGDVNGDGYSDVIVGAPYYDDGETGEGIAFVYYGNGGGCALVPRQKRFNSTIPVQILNATGGTGVRLNVLGRTPGGRGKVKLQWEIKELGQLFDGTDLGISSDWYNTGVSGFEINEDIAGLQTSTAYHWRARLQYSSLTYNGAIFSRWFSIGPNGTNETDFITTALTSVEEWNSNTPTTVNLIVHPSLSNRTFRIQYYVCKNIEMSERHAARLKIYDGAGRLVKTLIDRKISAGS